MSCGCGGRAVQVLKRLGYTVDREAEELVNGPVRIPVQELVQHPTRLTLRALWRYLVRGASLEEVPHGTP